MVNPLALKIRIWEKIQSDIADQHIPAKAYSMLFGSSIYLLDPHLPKLSLPILPVSVLVLHCPLSLSAGYPVAILGSSPAV